MISNELDPSDVALSAERAALAEIGFMTGAGPACAVLTPLRIGDRACFALSYDLSDLADQVGRAGEVVVTFSDSRLAYKGWKPLAARVRCDVFADPEGTLFQSKLLEQELRKHPPSRILIDTPLMRREHWWYVPRWIVRVAEVLGVHPIKRRRTPDDALIMYRGESGITATTITVPDWGADAIRLEPEGLLPNGPALVMKHDFSIPDLEDRSTYVVAGQISNNEFHAERREGTVELGPRRKLIERLQAQRQLKRSCMEQLHRQENQ